MISMYENMATLSPSYIHKLNIDEVQIKPISTMFITFSLQIDLALLSEFQLVHCMLQ